MRLPILLFLDTTTETEHEDNERESHLTIMRGFLSSTNCDSWKPTVIFETKMLYGGKILLSVL